jgi:hypothetical protein
MDAVIVADTRRSWHGLAELVLAGPQYRRSGTIRLRVTPGGFGTVAEPDLRVDGDHLAVGDHRLPLAGTTYAEVGALAGVDVAGPGLYGDGSGVLPEEDIRIDAAAAAYLADCFVRGDAALRALAPGVEPVLWPEHFDLAVTVEEINYGVSPGDGYLAEPYAYVGPWRPRTGPFFTAPFGAARRLGDLADAGAVVAWFTDGRAAAEAEGP